MRLFSLGKLSFRLFFIVIVQILVSVKEMEMSRWLKPEQFLELSYKLKKRTLEPYFSGLYKFSADSLFILEAMNYGFFEALFLAHHNVTHPWLVQ